MKKGLWRMKFAAKSTDSKEMIPVPANYLRLIKNVLIAQMFSFILSSIQQSPGGSEQKLVLNESFESIKHLCVI